jgi:putative restriction endonuclease
MSVFFALGYLTATFDFKVQISRRIKEEFEDGRDYYALKDRPLVVLPHQENARPAPMVLHEFYKGGR